MKLLGLIFILQVWSAEVLIPQFEGKTCLFELEVFLSLLVLRCTGLCN